MVQGQSVKRQADSTLRCMQTLARLQSQVRQRRIRMSEDNQALQRQLQQKHEKELVKLQAAVSILCIFSFSTMHDKNLFDVTLVSLTIVIFYLYKCVICNEVAKIFVQQVGEDWDASLQSKEQIEAKLLQRQEAAFKRERALAYSFSHQVPMLPQILVQYK